jgi:hypothetical protein
MQLGEIQDGVHIHSCTWGGCLERRPCGARTLTQQAFLDVDDQTRLLELLDKPAQVGQMLASEQLATIMLFK